MRTKHLKITRVPQEQKYGCVPACIAMILNKPYWEIAEKFETDLTTSGITHSKAAEFISAYGWSSLTKYINAYSHHKDWARDEMLRPFAPVHIVSVQPFADSEFNHCVVMTYDGKFLDPQDGTHTVEDAWSVDTITGLWSPQTASQSPRLRKKREVKKV